MHRKLKQEARIRKVLDSQRRILELQLKDAERKEKKNKLKWYK